MFDVWVSTSATSHSYSYIIMLFLGCYVSYLIFFSASRQRFSDNSKRFSIYVSDRLYLETVIYRFVITFWLTCINSAGEFPYYKSPCLFMVMSGSLISWLDNTISHYYLSRYWPLVSSDACVRPTAPLIYSSSDLFDFLVAIKI
jgi:hypothetical protein